VGNDAKVPRISVSVGVAIYPRDGRTIENLLRAADRALYKMKSERQTAPSKIPVG
jgi:diguanylate cyclase (GGDEF)-like protein